MPQDIINSQFQQAIASGTTQTPYIQKSFTLAASEIVDVFESFKFFRCLALTGSGLAVSFGENGQQSDFVGAGLGVQLPEAVGKIRLFNTSGAPLTVQIALSMGDIRDDRLNVSGAVAISSVTPGTGATELGKAEDQLHVSGDVGVMALTVRNDSLLASRTGTNNDYNPIATSQKGAVFVNPASGFFATSQVSVGTAAAQIVTANSANSEVTIKAGVEDLYISNTNAVTTANGFLIKAGESFSFNTMTNVWGIRPTSTQTAYAYTGQS